MDKRVKDLSGLKFGFLTVLRYAGRHKRGALWAVKCVCGKEINLPSGDITKNLQRKRQASCGCKRNETIARRNTKHAMSFHPAYRAWDAMRARCYRPSHAAWKNYGGRGIKVCERWRISFASFWEDMGPTWQPGLTLERVDNSQGYSPSNCVWATYTQQLNNTRSNTVIETPAGPMTVANAARHYKINYGTLLYRVKQQWPTLRALNLSTT